MPSNQLAEAARPASRGRPGSFALLCLVCVGVVALSLAVGAGSLRTGDMAALLQARGDRTFVGALVGAAVATAGTAMQGLTRNALADPGILGINAGAAMCVVMGISFAGITSFGAYFVLALVGALAATAAVTMMAKAAARGFGATSATPVSFALAGMVFTAAATSIASAVLVANSKSLEVYRYWQVGSVAGREISQTLAALPLFTVGFAVLLLGARKLDLLAMGDSVAVGLGENPNRLRFVLGAAAVLLAAAAVSISGPIAFVGLLAGHLLRPLVGTSYRRLIPASAVVGAIVVILGDTLGRVVSPPGEVQVGIMTAVIGCPALLWVLARMRSL